MEEAFSLGYWPIAQENTGDSLYNNVIYKKFKNSSSTKVSLVREDSTQKKVWVILPDSSSETLLYDFNLTNGNQVTLNYVGYYPVTYQVDSVDSVLTTLGIRKRINLSTLDTLFDSELIWIEGIGSTYGPIYLLDPTFDANLAVSYIRHELICAYKSMGVQSYGNSPPGSFATSFGSPCLTFINPTTITKINSKDIFFHPNPATSHFTINNLKQPYNLNIRNILGQLIYKENNILESSKKIDLSSYKKGILYIRIESENGVYIHKLIKK